jgi:hypothetical protein
VDRDEWVLDQNDFHYHHYGQDYGDEQLDWLGVIYDEYADDEGNVDFSEHTMGDGAWYYLMSEVYGLDDDTIERYAD